MKLEGLLTGWTVDIVRLDNLCYTGCGKQLDFLLIFVRVLLLQRTAFLRWLQVDSICTTSEAFFYMLEQYLS